MGQQLAPPELREPETRRGVTRRQVLVGGGTVAAAGATAAVVAGCGGGKKTPSYPKLTIAKLSSIEPNKPISFAYPLAGQPSVLVDVDQAVPEGVGPKQSIVAYSVLCQHMGCPIVYQPALGEFVCPCHQSRYDPGRLGSIVQGVAMLPLPRVLLAVNNGSVQAVGVDGLIYGYRDNLHPGKRA
jgi:arsenite oxidase small subunit